MNSVVVWVAQGFGVGRIPFAPGTFGSLLGILWAILIMRTGNFWLFLCGTMAGLAISVWLCGRAERILDQTDPGSIVLDEIAAMPLCFAGHLGIAWLQTRELTMPNWGVLAIAFVLFRAFDIAKPWPIRGSQRLTGGWGVTIDDALAAIYVALILAIPEVWRLVRQ